MAQPTPSEVTPLNPKDDEKTQTWSAYTYQVLMVGMGFLADAYDLFVIDMVMSILHRLHPGGMGANDKSMVASATLVGAIIGQVSFGLLGDWIGRRWTFMATCVLIIMGAVLSGCVTWGGPVALVTQLALCRFCLGVGVGGEYPLAATIAAEGASFGSRGRLIAAIFSMQGWGMLLSCLFVLLFLQIGMPLEYIWRAVLILGAVPSFAVIFLRSKMEESRLFTEAQQQRVAASGKEERPPLSVHFRQSCKYIQQFWRPMIGTTMTWLLLDVTFYGAGSFKHRISTTIMGPAHGDTARDEVWHEAVFATICCCFAIPGYLLSVAFIDKIGRYNLQLWGFLAMAANFFLVGYLSGIDLSRSWQWTLVLCFGLTFLFSNFGPNATTFVLPVEVYPTLIRATCHGISAAAGKIGAVIGVAAFSPCEAAFGLPTVLAGCGLVALSGAVFTFYFTSDKVVDLRVLDEAVSGEAANA